MQRQHKSPLNFTVKALRHKSLLSVREESACTKGMIGKLTGSLLRGVGTDGRAEPSSSTEAITQAQDSSVDELWSGSSAFRGKSQGHLAKKKIKFSLV